MKSITKKLSVLILLLVCVSALSFTAQAASAKQISKSIKSDVKLLEKGFRNRSQSTMKKALANPSKSGIGNGYNNAKALDRYMKNAHKSVRLKVIAIEMDGTNGKKATVTIRAKYISCYSAWRAVVYDLAYSRKSVTTSAIENSFAVQIKKYPGTKVTKDYVVKFVKKGSQWKLNCADKASCNFVQNLYIADFSTAMS